MIERKEWGKTKKVGTQRKIRKEKGEKQDTNGRKKAENKSDDEKGKNRRR